MSDKNLFLGDSENGALLPGCDKARPVLLFPNIAYQLNNASYPTENEENPNCALEPTAYVQQADAVSEAIATSGTEANDSYAITVKTENNDGDDIVHFEQPDTVSGAYATIDSGITCPESFDSLGITVKEEKHDGDDKVHIEVPDTVSGASATLDRSITCPGSFDSLGITVKEEKHDGDDKVHIEVPDTDTDRSITCPEAFDSLGITVKEETNVCDDDNDNTALETISDIDIKHDMADIEQESCSANKAFESHFPVSEPDNDTATVSSEIAYIQGLTKHFNTSLHAVRPDIASAGLAKLIINMSTAMKGTSPSINDVVHVPTSEQSKLLSESGHISSVPIHSTSKTLPQTSLPFPARTHVSSTLSQLLVAQSASYAGQVKIKRAVSSQVNATKEQHAQLDGKHVEKEPRNCPGPSIYLHSSQAQVSTSLQLSNTQQCSPDNIYLPALKTLPVSGQGEIIFSNATSCAKTTASKFLPSTLCSKPQPPPAIIQAVVMGAHNPVAGAVTNQNNVSASSVSRSLFLLNQLRAQNGLVPAAIGIPIIPAGFPVALAVRTQGNVSASPPSTLTSFSALQPRLSQHGMIPAAIRPPVGIPVARAIRSKIDMSATSSKFIPSVSSIQQLPSHNGVIPAAIRMPVGIPVVKAIGNKINVTATSSNSTPSVSSIKQPSSHNGVIPAAIRMPVGISIAEAIGSKINVTATSSSYIPSLSSVQQLSSQNGVIPAAIRVPVGIQVAASANPINVSSTSSDYLPSVCSFPQLTAKNVTSAEEHVSKSNISASNARSVAKTYFAATDTRSSDVKRRYKIRPAVELNSNYCIAPDMLVEKKTKDLESLLKDLSEISKEQTLSSSDNCLPLKSAYAEYDIVYDFYGFDTYSRVVSHLKAWQIKLQTSVLKVTREDDLLLDICVDNDEELASEWWYDVSGAKQIIDVCNVDVFDRPEVSAALKNRVPISEFKYAFSEYLYPSELPCHTKLSRKMLRWTLATNEPDTQKWNKSTTYQCRKNCKLLGNISFDQEKIKIGCGTKNRCSRAEPLSEELFVEPMYIVESRPDIHVRCGYRYTMHVAAVKMSPLLWDFNHKSTKHILCPQVVNARGKNGTVLLVFIPVSLVHRPMIENCSFTQKGCDKSFVVFVPFMSLYSCYSIVVKTYTILCMLEGIGGVIKNMDLQFAKWENSGVDRRNEVEYTFVAMQPAKKWKTTSARAGLEIAAVAQIHSDVPISTVSDENGASIASKVASTAHATLVGVNTSSDSQSQTKRPVKVNVKTLVGTVDTLVEGSVAMDDSVCFRKRKRKVADNLATSNSSRRKKSKFGSETDTADSE